VSLCENLDREILFTWSRISSEAIREGVIHMRPHHNFPNEIKEKKFSSALFPQGINSFSTVFLFLVFSGFEMRRTFFCLESAKKVLRPLGIYQ